MDQNNEAFDVLSIVFEEDDEKFQAMANMVLEELAMAVNNPMFKREMIQAFQGAGFFGEDAEKSYQELVYAIEETQELDDRRKKFIKDYISLMFGAWFAGDREFNDTVVPYELCRDRGDIPVPQYMNDGDSGMDVYALEDYEIEPGGIQMIPTGIKMAIPKGYEIQVRNKSGVAYRTKLRVANTPGTIDASYRDEVCVLVENIDPVIRNIEYDFDEETGQAILKSVEHGRPYFIEKGTRFAQLVLAPVERALLQEVSDVTSIGFNRDGGFGSTGLD